MRAEINEIKNRKNNRENWWHKKLAFWKDQERYWNKEKDDIKR